MPRRINTFNRGYQPRNNLFKVRMMICFADPHNILNGWKNYFSQSLYVHDVSDIGQMEVHTTELLVHGTSHLEFEIAITKLINYACLCSDQILVELIQAGSERLVLVVHKLINSIWITEELPDQWKLSVIVPIHKKGDKTD
jgi:hypothetical protein